MFLQSRLNTSDYHQLVEQTSVGTSSEHTTWTEQTRQQTCLTSLSNIGPLLFILYINELAEVLGHLYVTSKFFADDLKMYAEIITTIDATNFQITINQLVDWCSEWQMQISIKKCAILQIGACAISPDLHINNQALPKIASCKDLGVIFDQSFWLRPHCINCVVCQSACVSNFSFFCVSKLRCSGQGLLYLC